MRSRPPWCALLLAWAATHAAAQASPPPGILGLQGAAQTERILLRDARGPAGEAALTHLNPRINAWFLLTLPGDGSGAGTATYHLENAAPARQTLAWDAAHPGTLRLHTAAGDAACALWPGPALDQARRAGLPYAPLCEGRLYLRNAVSARRSTLEATTDFLRDHVWGGEAVVGLVKRGFFQDAYVERGRAASAPGAEAATPPPDAPPAAALRAPGPAPLPALVPTSLGIAIAPPPGRPADPMPAMAPGRWFAAAGLDHVHVSAVLPGQVAPPGPARPLDAVEADALAYLVAFDLAAFDVGFALGSDHPRLGWSDRVGPALRAGRAGPDGIDSAAPLVRSGMVSPALQARTVATFTGGFKREHGAFRWGPLAGVNHGSHYGFVEQGVVFSTLQPGLATLAVLDDGTVVMKTWTAADQALLPRIRHARQNGVALVERGADGRSVTGPLVDQWGPGNWSGSADEQLRSLRAGACLVEGSGRRHLVYGWFSTATPRAMAQVFLAYRCSYAMHLDMNALEHTYLALYPRSGGRVGVEHLVQGMAVLDPRSGNTTVPRFLGYPDSRDFFYLTTRSPAP